MRQQCESTICVSNVCQQCVSAMCVSNETKASRYLLLFSNNKFAAYQQSRMSPRVKPLVRSIHLSGGSMTQHKSKIHEDREMMDVCITVCITGDGAPLKARVYHGTTHLLRRKRNVPAANRSKPTPASRSLTRRNVPA